MAYIQGFLLAVPAENKAAYRQMAEDSWAIFQRHGCLAMRECWGVDTPEGKETSFPMAVKRKDGEVVVFAWLEWPDRATCDRAAEAMQTEPMMQDMPEMPFDGMRMMWGGFEELVRRGGA
ncbi:DUF1428 domain-containing protein [Pontibaca methylaminivorans]|uniref:Uncharacterized conserved protein YbaA, DUF1428 family n=1 Tax=Pontibaca methylaminivorans TaxID=515897 RepID=A0A1R3X798_9RHOB|nr:DUF1428 domain-containing protein [Pontibaca methylaminivorans]SIT86775.1 Uncharacterized conserved protein YbaA, DUF1428 family [Pontibaca methylaminivorans]